MDEGDTYQELRPLLFSIAYQMVGSASEAEDLVQEAYLRFHRAVAGGAEVDSPKAYLSAVTTRLAIDHLRSARVRREQYVGAWLPEPLVTGGKADPGGPGSRPPGASARSSPAGSSPPSTRATPRAWLACWPPTPSSTATGAARPRP